MATAASSNLLGVLMATSLASGAGALELNQTPSPPTNEAPSIALPAFCDMARMPELQEAWRAHFAANAAAPGRATSGSAAAIDQSFGARTRQLIARAAVTDREAAEVRLRAEELSRRFATPADQATAPSNIETASIEPVTLRSDSGDAVPVTAEQPSVEVVAREVPSATEDMAKPPRMRVKRAAAPVPPRAVVRSVVKKPSPSKLPADKAGIGPAGRMATDYSGWDVFPQKP